MYSVSDETRKPIFEGVQGENEAREIQFDVTAWVEELGEGVCTATAKRPTDTTPYPVTVTRSGNVVTWKPNSTDTSIEGIGAFQLAFSINDVVAKTRIWNTKIAPSLVGAGDPPDPYDDWIQDLRDIAAETLTYSQNAANSADDAEAEKLESEAWAKGTKNGTPVPSTADQYENNAKYWAEQSLANQYGAFIVKSASGEIASFSDGADDVPMKSVKVAIVPKQSGSGDPSPSNVRPITGTSTANVTVDGFNLWDEEWELGTILPATGQNYPSTNKIRSKNYIPVVPNTQFCISQSVSIADSDVVCFYRADKSYIRSENFVHDTRILFTFTPPADARYMRFIIRGTSYNSDICVNISDPSKNGTYVPYNGHTTPVPFGQTVYGGEVNPISGELKITHAMWSGTIADMSAQETISGYTRFLKYPAFPASTSPSSSNGKISNIAKYDWSDAYTSTHWYNNAYGAVILYAPADIATSTAVQFVCEMATPTTVQLTPTQVASLLGTNNVWSDAGAVEVEYRADPTLAYAELQALILENL